jgi:anti-sigma-K factor RskA
MSATDHSRWSENLPAYLLGALEPEEAQEFERHLESCESCREEVRWLAPAAEALPESVRRLEPPARLREQLMAEVREDAARAAPEGGSTGEGSGGRSLRDRLGLGSLGWRGAVALGAVALVLVAVVGYEIGNRGSGSGGAKGRTIVAGHAPGVTAKVITKGPGNTLRLAHVHEPPKGDVLEAWLERKGKLEPVLDLFTPNQAGRASTTIVNLRGVKTVLVTYEPRGGTKAPTTTPIIAIPIPEQ